MNKARNSSPKKRPSNGIAWPIRCTTCGKGKVNPLAKAGRTATYKNMMGLVLPEDLAIPTCGSCGGQWIDRATALAMDEALEWQYQSRLRDLAVAHLEKLGAQEITQRRLEQILGLSQGYLSKIRSGTSRPSPMLVNCLYLLAADPERRLREVEEGLAAA